MHLGLEMFIYCFKEQHHKFYACYMYLLKSACYGSYFFCEIKWLAPGLGFERKTADRSLPFLVKLVI